MKYISIFANEKTRYMDWKEKAKRIQRGCFYRVPDGYFAKKIQIIKPQ